MSHERQPGMGFDLDRAMAMARSDWQAGADLGALRGNIDALDAEISILLA